MLVICWITVVDGDLFVVSSHQQRFAAKGLDLCSSHNTALCQALLVLTVICKFLFVLFTKTSLTA